MNSNYVFRRVHSFQAAAALMALIGLGGTRVAAATESSQAATAVSASTPDKVASRAEIIADLRLWLRAGVDQYSDLAARDADSYGYGRALAKYEALRSGPAYGEELARVKRDLDSVMASERKPEHAAGNAY